MTEPLWEEKYRPKRVEDCILPKETKKYLLESVRSGNLDNFLFKGSAGTGKTTAARAICDELGLNTLFINASDDSGIDLVRNRIKSFASSVSLTGGAKVVILDEADGLNANSAQPALRSFISEFSKNCRFIMTCNYPNKLIDPLRSRFTEVDFAIPVNEKKDLMGELFTSVQNILKQEGVQFEKPIIAEVIKKHFPDNRRIIKKLQKYAVMSGGKIDEGIMVKSDDVHIDELLGMLKSKQFNKVRQWVVDNINNDNSMLFRKFYEGISKGVVPDSLPLLVVTLADYQYKSAFVIDHEVNTLACLTEIMMQCEFK